VKSVVKLSYEMVINEIFYSLQGEGLLAGVPSVFIRLAGCPLHCKWCDTKYALDSQAGEDLDVAAIIENVSRWQCRYVVITGGEPMANERLPELTSALKKQGKHITIETAGIVFIEDLACDLISISPKLSNSGQKKVPDTLLYSNRSLSVVLGSYIEDKKVPDTFLIRQLIGHYTYQLKFVVDSPDDLSEIQQTVELLGNIDTQRIMLMPQAKTRDELIAKSPMVAELCKQTGFTFCNRLQILLYDGEKGK
jgi:7-carboxy-7-deazaguanine synthase